MSLCSYQVEVCNALRLSSEFRTFYAHSHDVLEFLTIKINEVNTMQYFGIVELWFLDSPLMLLFTFRRIGHIFPILWPQSVWSGGRLFSCQSLTRPCIPGGFSFNIVNLVKPVHVSDNSRSPSTFHQSSMFLSNITPKDVSVVRVTSIYFSGKGNDSSLGTYSLTLGSTWWRWMKLPVMDQKSFLASPSYHDESRSGAAEDPSDSPWRLSCSSPRSGLSRIKVDVLRTWSPPESFTVPPAIGNMNFSPPMGVDTSFALTLFT